MSHLKNTLVVLVARPSPSVSRKSSGGFPDVVRTVERVPGKKRILLLGDSVVVGHGIWDLEDPISRQLEGLFPWGDVEGLDFGIAGYDTGRKRRC